MLDAGRGIWIDKMPPGSFYLASWKNAAAGLDNLGHESGRWKRRVRTLWGGQIRGEIRLSDEARFCKVQKSKPEHLLRLLCSLEIVLTPPSATFPVKSDMAARGR